MSKPPMRDLIWAAAYAVAYANTTRDFAKSGVLVFSDRRSAIADAAADAAVAAFDQHSKGGPDDD